MRARKLDLIRNNRSATKKVIVILSYISSESATAIENQFDKSERKKVKLLLNLLRKIHLRTTTEGSVLYEDGVIGSPIFELVHYLVTNDDQSGRPWDAVKFMGLLRKQQPAGDWKFLSRSKKYLITGEANKKKRRMSSPLPPKKDVCSQYT